MLACEGEGDEDLSGGGVVVGFFKYGFVEAIEAIDDLEEGEGNARCSAIDVFSGSVTEGTTP